MNRSIFKAYDIRGIYPEEINEEAARKIAQAYLLRLKNKTGKDFKDLKIVVSQDARLSSKNLAEAVIEEFLTYGVNVDDLGVTSVNDIYVAVGLNGYDGGLIATASHNPANYGGFKMAGIDNGSIEFLRGAEIEKLLDQVLPPTTETRGVRRAVDLSEEHLQHILSFIDVKNIRPLKVVVDAGNGTMGLLTPRLFAKTIANLIPLFFEPDGNFPNRPPNPLAENAFAKLADKIKAENADFGIIFDADGDRMFLVDELGNFVPGDMILLLLAKRMINKNPGTGIVYNLICSKAVPELVTKWGGKAIRSEVGYLNLARHMQEEGGEMSGEVSAHFAFKHNFYADSGFIAMALVLEALSLDSRPLSEIIKEFKLYYRGFEVNFKVESIAAAIALAEEHYQKNVRDKIDGLTVEFPDWWFNLRGSNTEPLLRLTVEAENEEVWRLKRDEVLEVINGCL